MKATKPVTKSREPHYLSLPIDKGICVHLEIHDDGVKRCVNAATIKGRHGWTCSSHAREVRSTMPPSGLNLSLGPDSFNVIESMSCFGFLYAQRNRLRLDRYKARFLDKVDDAELKAMIARSQGHSN